MAVWGPISTRIGAHRQRAPRLVRIWQPPPQAAAEGNGLLGGEDRKSVKESTQDARICLTGAWASNVSKSARLTPPSRPPINTFYPAHLRPQTSPIDDAARCSQPEGPPPTTEKAAWQTKGLACKQNCWSTGKPHSELAAKTCRRERPRPKHIGVALAPATAAAKVPARPTLTLKPCGVCDGCSRGGKERVRARERSPKPRRVEELARAFVMGVFGFRWWAHRCRPHAALESPPDKPLMAGSRSAVLVRLLPM